ncbi:MAG: thioredoxin family protein [Candidatus Thermoplasmatota archaeon]|nr:thioredoxin family protein [Candidatus Thermoplasmatota archaeon]
MKLDPGVPILDREALEARIEGEDLLTVLFYADWCGFCHRFMPPFRDHAEAIPGAVVAANISRESDPRWDTYQIQAVPTLVVFKQGAPLLKADSVPGLGLTERHLKALIKELDG